MHALGEYLSQQIQERGWSTSELARRAGLTKQSVSNLMADRDHLGRMLEPRTFNGLADALGVPAEVLVLKAAVAMGIPVPPPEAADETTHADSPPATMEELSAFLAGGLPSEVLVSYLHRYLRLVEIVSQALAEQHGYAWGPDPGFLADDGPSVEASAGDGAGDN